MIYMTPFEHFISFLSWYIFKLAVKEHGYLGVIWGRSKAEWRKPSNIEYKTETEGQGKAVNVAKYQINLATLITLLALTFVSRSQQGWAIRL